MKKGYTLIELLITIVIVAIMLSIFIPTIIVVYNKLITTTSNNLKEEIYSKTSDYLIDNDITYQTSNNYQYACISIKDLNITKSLTDPKKDLDYTNYYVKITRNEENILKKEIVEEQISCYDYKILALIPSVKEILEVNKDVITSNDVKAFYQNKDLSSKIKIINKKNEAIINYDQPFAELGDYELIFSINEDEINQSITKKIKVVDTTPPTVEIIGGSELILNIDDSYKEQGISIKDNYYPETITTENLNDDYYQVTITSNMNTSKKGEYQVKYQVTDKSNNQIEVTKKIIINNQNTILYSYSKKTCHEEHETIYYDNWEDCLLPDGTLSKCNKQYNKIETKNVCEYGEYSPWTSVKVENDEDTKVKKKTCLLDQENQVISSTCVITE